LSGICAFSESQVCSECVCKAIQTGQELSSGERYRKQTQSLSCSRTAGFRTPPAELKQGIPNINLNSSLRQSRTGTAPALVQAHKRFCKVAPSLVANHASGTPSISIRNLMTASYSLWKSPLTCTGCAMSPATLFFSGSAAGP